jgi:hypothetical protein
MDQNFWLNWAVNLFSALGTIGAVIVALFGDQIRRWLWPPRLQIQLADDVGVQTRYRLQASDRLPRGSSRWYHIRVQNPSRWSPVSSVQVFILRIEETDAEGEFTPTWIGELPIRWRYQEARPLTITLGPAMDADACNVVKDSWVEFHPIIRPHAIRPRRSPPTKLRLLFQAKGIEADQTCSAFPFHGMANGPMILKK